MGQERDWIKDRVRENLWRAGLAVDDVRVQPGPVGGWRVAVISPGFEGMAFAERKRVALEGLEGLDIDWLDLLTPSERELAGVLPIDSDLESVPSWPEAIARGEQALSPVKFASDLDEDLGPPIVVTFYSLRGGVGRSTALAYTARILASRGRKVVCVDADLEAPGLVSLMGKEGEVGKGQGLASLLVQIDSGERPDVTKHLIRISEELDLYCIPAGQVNSEYAQLLRLIDPTAWYREERNPLRSLLTALETELPFKPDAILLDARTGLTPLSAPLLLDLADLVVIVFFPHPQSYSGTKTLVQALLAAKTRRPQGLTPEPRFLVSPVPQSKAPEVVERYRHRSLQWIAEWLSPVNQMRPPGSGILESEITHFVPYREAIATSDRILESEEIWRDFEPVADWIQRFLLTESELLKPISVGNVKSRILDELRFSTGTAEQQEDLHETFVQTALVLKAMSADIPLVLGRKGTGKTAIFRLLSESEEHRGVVVHAPPGLRVAWSPSPDGFAAIAQVLAARNAHWRHFWMFDSGIALHKALAGSATESYPEPIRLALQNGLENEGQLVATFERIVVVPNLGLLLNEWLEVLDRVASDTLLLLFDGLDTGFGSTDADRKRRAEAIAGLFEFWMDREPHLQNLRFKVLLREDIWRTLRVENRSHLYGRSVTLQWKSKEAFLKVALKQALRSRAFSKLVKDKLGKGYSEPPDGWAEQQVFNVWHLLVGERMKGGNTTFTRNWVWNRLADGNDDHSPRHLLQLFHEATAWERDEQKRNPYERSIIRPRGLQVHLPTVSTQALDALANEEFPELKPLLDRLREIGRTPIAQGELKGLDELVKLALEVGLLAVYEGTTENPQRYKVPELYRHALNMTRKGQL